MAVRPSKWWKGTALGLLVLLTGCSSSFFQPVNGGGNGGGGGSTTSSGYFYLGNYASTTLAGFNVNTSGKLSAVANSPYNVSNVIFNALAINTTNSFLYASVNAVDSGTIYAFSISSTGALTLANGGNPLVSSSVVPTSMKVDPSGKWLLVADANPVNMQVSSFGIDTSTGALSVGSSAPLSVDGNGQLPFSLLVTPNDANIFVSRGTGGVDTFTFNSSTGVITKSLHLKPLDTLNKDQGMASDAGSNYLFLTETNNGGLRVLKIGANASLTSINGSPFATGAGPRAVVVDPSNTYIYVANYADNSISGFSFAATTGTVTPLSVASYSTCGNPVDLSFEQTKTYLGVACSASNPDFQVFKVDTTTPGKLVSVTTTASGPNNAAGNPISLAATRYQ